MLLQIFVVAVGYRLQLFVVVQLVTGALLRCEYRGRKKLPDDDTTLQKAVVLSVSSEVLAN